MKILILVASYPPVVESAGRLYSQLAETLAVRHQVTVITEFPGDHVPVERSHPFWADPRRDVEQNGVRVRRVSPLTWLAKITVGKAVRFVLSGALFAARALPLDKQDVVLIYSPPLFLGISGWLLARWQRAPMVLNVQDLHPKVLFDSGAIKHALFKKVLLGMERLNYRDAAEIIVYSEGNRRYISSKQPWASIHVIPNWVDTADLVSAEASDGFRREEGIGARLLVSYAGTMQSAQGLEVVIEAAERLRSREDIVFFLAGEGTAKAELAAQVTARGLTNVIIRAVMPATRYLRCLAASDVCLVTLSNEVPPETVPGKLAYTLACGKPVLAAINLQGDAARIVVESGAGLCVRHGDGAAFAQAVITLDGNAELRREMGGKGRRYAHENFSREACVGRYEEVLRSTIAPTSQTT